MKTKKYKIGDRVKCTKEYDDKSEIVNKLGNINELCDNGEVCVEFDKNIGGHNGDDGKDGHCWYLGIDCIRPSKGKHSKPQKVTHIVIWDEENEDPIRLFNCLEDASELIKELSDRSDVKNIKLVEVKSIKEVKINKSLSFKEFKL